MAIINLNDVHQRFGLRRTADPAFFPEWREPLPALTGHEELALDKYGDRYLSYAAEGSSSEGTVGVFMVSPLLELLGHSVPPLRVPAEPHVKIAIDNEDKVLKGRIDIVIIQQRLWVVVIEAKHFGFSVMQAIPQTLAYMMEIPSTQATAYGLITTGEDFLFLKLQRQPSAQYALSNKFTLLSDEQNSLYQVTQVLKKLATHL